MEFVSVAVVTLGFAKGLFILVTTAVAKLFICLSVMGKESLLNV